MQIVFLVGKQRTVHAAELERREPVDGDLDVHLAHRAVVPHGAAVYLRQHCGA